MPKPIYMYFDEAGNFDFSPRGSRFYIMTSVVCARPFDAHADLLNIKYDCLEQGLDLDRFHASEDRQVVRDQVFDVIRQHRECFSAYAVIIRKNQTGPTLRDERQFYSHAFDWLTKYACPRSLGDADHVVAVTDKIPVNKKQGELKGALKSSFKTHLGERSYSLFHHESRGDLNLQIADYICWAIHRKWDQGDTRSYDLVSEIIRGEGDLPQHGGRDYY